MRFPGSYRIRKLVGRLLPRAIVLLYHRVAKVSSDPQLLCVTPEHFAEHMQILREQYRPGHLRNFRQHLWASQNVIVTFDDGYADNFHEARTLLETQDVPATIFVTSGKVDSQKEFWWDELEKIFLLSSTLPACLELRIDHKQYSWELGAESLTDHSFSWNVLALSHPTSRQRVYLDLVRLLHDLNVEEREDVLMMLLDWAMLDTSCSQAGYLPVKSDELVSLAADGLIDIGAHTVNHPALSALSPESQQKEIVESKKTLERILDRPVSTFAYPFGERKDYTLETVSIVRDAGFSCACSNYAGLVTTWSDPYQLPRFIVRDWDGDTFASKLRAWFRD